MATTGASLKPIYDQVNATPEYHPLSADTFADWSMEAGDMVTITREGNSYKAPVNSSRMTWKKGQQITITSEGSEKRDPISRVSQRKFRSGGAGLRNSTYQHIYAEDIYKRLKAGLELTASTAHLYVDEAYTQLKAGLYLTSSTANLYVRDAYKRMQAGLAATSSSAALYAEKRTSKAEIIARINENGSSEALINADRIRMSGTTTLNGVMSVQNGIAMFTHGALVSGGNLQLLSSSGIQINGSTPGSTLSLGFNDFNGMITKAEVDGNTLKLWKRGTPTTGSPSITFSKATQLSASWDGNRKFTVSASPQGVSRYTQLVSAVPQADQVWSGRNGTLTLRATMDGGETTVVAGKVTLTAPDQYPNSMTLTRSKAGRTSGGLDVYYGQLYYWDDDDGSYMPAAAGNHYWYYSSTNRAGANVVHY